MKENKVTNKRTTEKEIKEHFDFFIEKIPFHMNKAKEWLKKTELEYSFEEIDEIGKLYSELYTKSRIQGRWYDPKYEIFVTYCGEAFMKYFLGRWSLNLKINTSDFGESLITNYGPDDYHWIALNPAHWLKMIEEGDNAPLSRIYSRKVHMFNSFPEWNFNPIENLKASFNNE